MVHSMASALVVLALGLPSVAQADAPPVLRVECLRTGEGQVAGRLRGIQAGRLTLLRNGREEEFPISSFREIVFDGPPPHVVPPPFTIWGRNDRLFAVRRIAAGAAAGTLNLEGYGWRGTNIPLASLRAVATRRFLRDGPAEEIESFRESREDPPVGHDRVMLRRDERRQVFSCAVERMTEEGVGLALAGSQKTARWDDVEWIVLSPSAPASAPEGGHLVQPADGSRLRVRAPELKDGVLSGEDGEARYRVNAHRLRRIRVASEAYVYLSDLKPDNVKLKPVLDVVWQPRLDLDVTGRAIELDGRIYPKGIGTHVHTEMTFATGGGYLHFYAMIGVDDTAGDLGSVVFRVLADGRSIFRSKPLGGRDAPEPIALDIRGARRLTLVTEPGSPVEPCGNFADWAEARLVRQPSQ